MDRKIELFAQFGFYLRKDFPVLSGLFAGIFVAFPTLGAEFSYFSFEARKSASMRFIVASRFFFVSSHYHTVMTVQASVSSIWALFKSRSMLRATFACQNSTFDFGTTYFVHPLCPYQKHPLMKMTALYFGSTRSGVPGSLRSLSRYR